MDGRVEVVGKKQRRRQKRWEVRLKKRRAEWAGERGEVGDCVVFTDVNRRAGGPVVRRKSLFVDDTFHPLPPPLTLRTQKFAGEKPFCKSQW